MPLDLVEAVQAGDGLVAAFNLEGDTTAAGRHIGHEAFFNAAADLHHQSVADLQPSLHRSFAARIGLASALDVISFDSAFTMLIGLCGSPIQEWQHDFATCFAGRVHGPEVGVIVGPREHEAGTASA